MKRSHVAIAVAAVFTFSFAAPTVSTQQGCRRAAAGAARHASAPVVGEQEQGRSIREEQAAHQAQRSESAPQGPGQLDRGCRGGRELPLDVQLRRARHEDHAADASGHARIFRRRRRGDAVHARRAAGAHHRQTRICREHPEEDDVLGGGCRIGAGALG